MSTTISIYFHQHHFVLFLLTFAFLYVKLATLPRVAAWHRRQASMPRRAHWLRIVPKHNDEVFMTPAVKSIIDNIIKVEGGYSNNQNDSGGETMYGITKSVAAANGYTSAMKDLPISLAENIYYTQYVSKPKFDLLIPLSESIAAEVIDTGVNMGPSVAGKFLQRCLNAFNNQGKAYADIAVDGKVGPATASALKSYLGARGKQGETVMLKALNCLQGARYIELAEANQKNETFVYGWIANRISL